MLQCSWLWAAVSAPVAQDGKAHDAASEAFTLDARMRAAVAAAQTAEEMHAALGRDCWVVVPIASIAQPGLLLEGSRLTLVRSQKLDNETTPPRL